jgi:hypothetical protein
MVACKAEWRNGPTGQKKEGNDVAARKIRRKEQGGMDRREGQREKGTDKRGRDGERRGRVAEGRIEEGRTERGSG